jgi:hypothetical protein
MTLFTCDHEATVRRSNGLNPLVGVQRPCVAVRQTDKPAPKGQRAVAIHSCCGLMQASCVQAVPHIAHPIEHGGLIGVVAPLPIHNELVLVHSCIYGSRPPSHNKDDVLVWTGLAHSSQAGRQQLGREGPALEPRGHSPYSLTCAMNFLTGTPTSIDTPALPCACTASSHANPHQT